jgi:poly(3-hydroxybutyrate) depolymerase
MHTLLIAGLALWLSVVAATPASAQKVVKETLDYGSGRRTYYLFVPERDRRPAQDASTSDTPTPLIVLLHGSGRDGKSLTDKWAPLAKKERIILAAPDALNPRGWSMQDDGPGFLRTLVELLRVQHDVDPRRVYLFGHSAGAVYGLSMAVLESEYFAAVAVHAGALNPSIEPFIERAPRKIPIGIWIGTNDDRFPLSAVRASRDTLTNGGFPVQFTEMPGHTHWYYDRAPDINRKVWEFLREVRLDDEPRFQPYEVRASSR